MRTSFIVCVAAALTIALSTGLRGQGGASADHPIVWSASDLKWTDNPAIKGARQAVLWGDPAKEAYGALKSVPAGTALAAHTHSTLTRFVVISGTLEFGIDGGQPRSLGPQAYGSIPAGVKHSARCQSGSPCVYFETAPAAYDLKPAAF